MKQITKWKISETMAWVSTLAVFITVVIILCIAVMKTINSIDFLKNKNYLFPQDRGGSQAKE